VRERERDSSRCYVMAVRAKWTAWLDWSSVRRTMKGKRLDRKWLWSILRYCSCEGLLLASFEPISLRKQVHTSTSSFYKINFNKILPSPLRSVFPPDFQTKIVYAFLIAPCVLHDLLSCDLFESVKLHDIMNNDAKYKSENAYSSFNPQYAHNGEVVL
jgi:hypothetical protein